MTDTIHAAGTHTQLPAVPPPSILIVDDEPDIRAIYLRLFRLRGCTATGAADLAEALALLAKSSITYDAVLLDLNLPDGPGEVVLATARHCPRLAGLRIVVHSATHDPERTDALAIRGASAFVGKPAAFGEVWAAVFPAAANRRTD